MGCTRVTFIGKFCSSKYAVTRTGAMSYGTAKYARPGRRSFGACMPSTAMFIFSPATSRSLNALTGSALAGRVAQKPIRVGLLIVLIVLGCQLALHSK